MDRSKKKQIEKKLTIGVNIRIYEQRASGIQNFIQGLFTDLIIQNPWYHFIFFTTGKKKIAHNAEYRIAKSPLISFFNTIHPLLMNIFFDNIYILMLMLPEKLDIFIAPSYVLPLIKPKRMKYITVVHDLSFLTYKHNPFKLYLNYVMYMKFIMPRVLQRADAVVVPSNYVKNQLKTIYGTNTQKIKVIYEGKDDFFFQDKREKIFQSLKKKYSISSQYCFTNATNHERKNIFGLIDAFSSCTIDDAIQLVITGLLPQFAVEELERYIRSRNIENKVTFLGYVSKEELRLLYSFAKLFIFPSFEEGFGLPILESASCGCLPICSRTGSLPEIIHNRRLLFDPRNSVSIQKKIEEIIGLSDKEYQKELAIVTAHIKNFTWKKAAEEFSYMFNTL